MSDYFCRLCYPWGKKKKQNRSFIYFLFCLSIVSCRKTGLNPSWFLVRGGSILDILPISPLLIKKKNPTKKQHVGWFLSTPMSRLVHSINDTMFCFDLLSIGTDKSLMHHQQWLRNMLFNQITNDTKGQEGRWLAWKSNSFAECQVVRHHKRSHHSYLAMD